MVVHALPVGFMTNQIHVLYNAHLGHRDLPFFVDLEVV